MATRDTTATLSYAIFPVIRRLFNCHLKRETNKLYLDSQSLIFEVHLTQVDLIGYQGMAHLPQVDTGDAHFVMYIKILKECSCVGLFLTHSNLS